MREFAIRLAQLVILLGLICGERVVGLPVFALTYAVLLYMSMSQGWKYTLFIIGSIALATVYGIPFGLSFFVFLLIWLPIDFLVLPQRVRDASILCAVLVSLGGVAFASHYIFTLYSLPILLFDLCVFSIVGTVFVRQRRSVGRYA